MVAFKTPDWFFERMVNVSRTKNCHTSRVHFKQRACSPLVTSEQPRSKYSLRFCMGNHYLQRVQNFPLNHTERNICLARSPVNFPYRKYRTDVLQHIYLLKQHKGFCIIYCNRLVFYDLSLSLSLSLLFTVVLQSWP
jgi:hypothetical protein